MLAPVRVRAAHGENIAAQDGCASPAVFKAISVAAVRPAPEDSLAIAIWEAGTPLSISPR
jgi:hypothetical protein